MLPTSASGIYLCQYWVKEPQRCSKWDLENIHCTYKEADFYPFCNLLGTQTKCGQYDGDKSKLQYMCVRPDPYRTVPSRKIGKWVNLPVLNKDGEVINAGDYNPITFYNKGACDGYGTALKCSGYMPFNMAFSALQPDDRAGSLGYDLDEITTTANLVFRLPLNFKIYNLRAKLSRCYWWKDSPQEFTVNASGIVQKPYYACTNPDEITLKFNDFYYDAKLNMYVPPCNGAKPECPRYTGVCWEYCIDKYMRHGDYVSAEQILELRYYIRKDRWTFEDYYNSFYEGDIFTWDGYLLDFNNIIPSHRVYFVDFEYFNIDSRSTALTTGLSSEGLWPSFPTLVRELKTTSLAPIIRNVFDKLENKNVFETSDINHKYITIFGDQFYYGSDTYAFNLNDPELDIPAYIKSFLLNNKSLSDAKANLVDTFDDLYQDYKNYIEFFINSSSDHVIKSDVGSDKNMFYMDVPTFFGTNTIIVVNNGSGEWEFDKITFEKIYVGGVIGQTSFKIHGTGVVNYLPSYEDSFTADLNNNGEVTFKFFSLTSYKVKIDNPVEYVYLDGVKRRLSPSLINPLPYTLWKMNYKLYKKTVFSNLELGINNIKFFGNAGYALVILPDDAKVLTNVIKPWEAEGIRLYYSTNNYIDMVIVAKCNDKLELNQCIIKPKSIADFSKVCSDVVLKIDKIYIYERHTASEVMADASYEEVNEEFIADDDVVTYTNSVIVDNGEYYSIEKFSDMPLVPSVVFKGHTGRIRGQVKTKLITWVRQPYCRDVEIYYKWKANYLQYKLLPEFVKYGPVGVETYNELVTKLYSPPCGDHDLSFITQIGPLWYPYSACAEYANYNIRSNILGVDIGIMEVFNDDYSSDYKHGQHDLRMLGPADNFGVICDIHSTIWTCHEDWSYCNLEKKGENIFVGYARYRGGLSYADKLKASQFGGSLPKFGNVYRDFLRSFRAVDNIDYYYWSGSGYIRKSKWVPMTELYSVMDAGGSITDYPYLTYISNDFYNDGSFYMDQFGLLLASTIENVNINEEIVNDDNGVVRFRFDEIFKAHWISGIYYPYPRKLYLHGNNLIPVISWYTYKDNPLGDITKSIQWVWREYWKDIERQKILFDYDWFDKFSVLSGHYINKNKAVIDSLLLKQYKESDGKVQGRHLFLDINYPPYKYNYLIEEHRLVCDEGEQLIKIYAPEISDDLTYDSSAVWRIQLNDGPIRCFNINGEWVDQITTSGAEECNINLYKVCTKDPWLDDVTIFDTGYASTAPSDDRTIITYDDVGDEVKNYYQRGLNVSLNTSRFNYLPYKLHMLDSKLYDLRLSVKPTLSENEWSTIESTEYFYPAKYDLNIDYNCKVEEVSITVYNDSGVSIGGMSVVFKVGALEGAYPDIDKKPIFSGQLYHVPAIKVYRSNDDVNYELVYENNNMLLYGKNDSFNTVNIFYEFLLSTQQKLIGSKYTKVVFRLKPTIDELNKYGDMVKYYDSIYVINHVFIDGLYFYYIEFIDAVEKITTYERKYAVSIGSHGDFPPHGYESTGSLLYKLPSDNATVYQMDSVYGVVGMPGSSGDHKTMNKLRGRIMKQCHADKEAISGPKDPHYYESRQKAIHDSIINEGGVQFNMESCLPPFLSEQLAELNIPFPRWKCVFENTYVRPLAEIIAFARYSPCGHKFVYDFDTLRYVPCILCGRTFPVPCVWKDIYDKVFTRACDDSYRKVPNTAVVAYFKGIANILIRPFEYFLAPTVERYESVSKVLRSWSGSVLMNLPDNVQNLY